MTGQSGPNTQPTPEQRLDERRLRELATEYKAAKAALDAMSTGSDKTDAEWDEYNAVVEQWDAAWDTWGAALRPFDGDDEQDLAANLVLGLAAYQQATHDEPSTAPDERLAALKCTDNHVTLWPAELKPYPTSCSCWVDSANGICRAVTNDTGSRFVHAAAYQQATHDEPSTAPDLDAIRARLNRRTEEGYGGQQASKDVRALMSALDEERRRHELTRVSLDLARAGGVVLEGELASAQAALAATTTATTEIPGPVRDTTGTFVVDPGSIHMGRDL